MKKIINKTIIKDHNLKNAMIFSKLLGELISNCQIGRCVLICSKMHRFYFLRYFFTNISYIHIGRHFLNFAKNLRVI